MSLDYYSAWLVWVIPLVSSIFIPIIGKYSKKIREFFVVTIALVTTVIALSLVPTVWLGNGEAVQYSIPWISGFVEAGVYIDSLSVLFTCLVAFFGVIISVYSLGYMKGEEGLTRYYYLLLLFIGSMIGLVISDNLLQMFIFWEMVGLCSYALISFWYKKPESIHSGVKVFLMTRIGDICLLAAIGMLFFTFNTFSFKEVIAGIGAGGFNTGYMVVVAFLVLGGAIAKSAQFPLFTWLYSAMEAPTSVSALLHAATMVKAGIYLLSRFILIFAAAPALIDALMPAWFPTIAWVGVITAFIGATLALMTTDIKGVLAYSTVSQIGFMMAGLGTAFSGHVVDVSLSTGWFASLFHMMSHAFFEGLGFLLAGGIIHALGTRDMRLMGGLKKVMPITFGLAIIMIITTSGLPPFASFFSKGLIITSVMETGNLVQVVLIFVTAALTFAYCVRMFSLVFMGKASEHMLGQRVHEAPWSMIVPAGVLGVLCVVWGVLQPFIAQFMHVELEHSLLSAFTSIETPIFFGLLLPTFLLAYFTYYRGFSGLRRVAAGRNPLTILLNHAYFLDDLYYTIAKGVGKLSEGFMCLDSLINHFCEKVGKGVGKLSEGFMCLDSLINQLMDFSAALFTRAISALNRLPLKTYQNYIVALILGILLIVIILLIVGGL